MSAFTRVTAARPSAELWNTSCGLKNATFAPCGNGAGGCAGAVGAGAGGWAGAGVGCAGLACAGAGAGGCANTGAALNANSVKAIDAAVAEPLITMNPFVLCMITACRSSQPGKPLILH
jgi:hypothetical protein